MNRLTVLRGKELTIPRHLTDKPSCPQHQNLPGVDGSDIRPLRNVILRQEILMASTLHRSFAARSTAIAGLAFLLVGAAFAQHYTRTDLTTDSSSVSGAPNIDPNLVNAWGLSRATSSPWWVSDNGTGLSTLYDLNGVPAIPGRHHPSAEKYEGTISSYGNDI